MNEEVFRALVIDDDYVVRNLTSRALRDEGFECDVAADGIRGAETLAAYRYDVVVTDLNMPGKNGHAVACELLAREDRPVVVVLTGVLEPRLATDLVKRGVDCVDFKPVQYGLFAAKVKGLVQRANRRLFAGGSSVEARNAAGDELPDAAGRMEDAGKSRAREDLLQKVSHLSKILPIPQAAFDVYDMARSERCDTRQIAAAIALNASLSLDILRLANTSFYNPLGSKVVKLDEAVLRIGLRRTGELALATGMMATMTANALPWMNLELVWRRSVAAGVAVDLLFDGDDYTEVEDGLFLAAIMHPLGRFALGTLFPQEYDEMFRTFETRGTTLAEQEESRFAMSVGEVISQLLKEWKLAPAIYEPLQFVTDNYALLAGRSEPLRTKSELLRLAVLIGQIAVGDWELWDRLESPPEYTLRRLHIDNMLADIIAKVRAETFAIINFNPRQGETKMSLDSPRRAMLSSLELAYCNLSPEPFDFLAAVIESMGINLQPASSLSLPVKQNVIVNCLRAQPDAFRALGRGSLSDGKQIIVADDQTAKRFAPFGEVVAVPCSFREFHAACHASASASAD